METEQRAPTLFCLAGVPGAGKTTIRQALVRRYPEDVVFLSRVTTRAVRPDEDGEVLHLPRAAFVAASRAGQLTARFCNNRAMYAVSIAELETKLRGPRRWIGCLAATAALALQERGFAVTTVYLTVADRSALVARLQARGLTDEETAMRMHEFDATDAEWRAVSADYTLSTDRLTIEATLAEVVQILGLP